MRKDHLNRRSRDETEAEGGDPLSGSADPFDAIVNSKVDDLPSKTNGGSAPSPIPEDSDNEEFADARSNEADTSASKADATNCNGSDDDANDKEGYEVEDIVDHKFKGKKKYFRIRWKNYEEKDDTWELEKDLSCQEIIDRYVAEHPEAGKEAKQKKVRISLPPSTGSRSTPKRTAAERKIVDDDMEFDDEQETKKSPNRRGRPKKNASSDDDSEKVSKGRGRPKRNAKAAKGKSSKKEEYEVAKIVDDEMRGGKKYFRVRWNGWSAKDDTWEPKSSLSCPEIIKAYESSKTEDYEVEKIVGEKVEYGIRYFLVKWKGWSESDNSWESEVDCHDLIEKFRDSCRSVKSNKRPAAASTKATKAKKARKNYAEDDVDDDDGESQDNDGDDEKEWEVEKVVNVRKSKGKKEYLIRWKGCKASQDTWEPEDGINCPELIQAFLKKNKK